MDELEEKRDKMSKMYSRAFTVLAVVMFAVETAFFGWNLAKENWQYAIANAILATFWFMAAWILHRGYLLDIEMKYMRREGKALDKMSKVLAELRDETEEVIEGKKTLKALEQKHYDLLAEKLALIIQEVVGRDRDPVQEDVPKITKLFEEQTKHFVELTLDEDGFGAKFDHKPFDTPTTSEETATTTEGAPKTRKRRRSKKTGETTTTTTTLPGQTSLVD